MRPWPARCAEAVAAVERWLLPLECLLCQGAPGPDDGLICGVCRARWRRLEDPRCDRCGQPLDPGVECRLCPDWPRGFGPVASAVWLGEGARRAVHLLKYDGWRRVADPLAAAMSSAIRLDPDAVLVPIPLGAARLRTRGYNQSALLAHALELRTGLRTDPSLLRRARETTTQTALTPEARQANVRGAFAARSASPAHAILVDDVFTTGATLVSAAIALLAAGARRVSAATFARAERPLDAVARALEPDHHR
jgi:ComF family protein